MKRIILGLAFLLGTAFGVSSCINDDDLLQEGTLRITFNNSTNIISDTKISVEVMDIADREHVIVEKSSVGTRPVEITLNTCNYLVRVIAGVNIKLQGVQIQRNKTTEVSI